MRGLAGPGQVASLALLASLALVVGCLPPGTAGALTRDEQLRFVVAVELAKGHLTSSRELYTLGQPAGASLHSSHPTQELGNRIIGPIRNVDAPLADQVRAALRKPSRAIEARVPAPQYDAVVQETLAALDRGVEAVVARDTQQSPKFQARLIERLLKTAADEYEESIKSTRIVRPVEYQDAYGFYRRVQGLYRRAPGLASQSLGASLEALGRAFPGVVPPERPLPAREVRAIVEHLSAALAATIGG